MAHDDRLLGAAWYGAELDTALAGMCPQVHWLGWRRRTTRLELRAATDMAARERRIARARERLR